MKAARPNYLPHRALWLALCLILLQTATGVAANGNPFGMALPMTVCLHTADSLVTDSVAKPENPARPMADDSIVAANAQQLAEMEAHADTAALNKASMQATPTAEGLPLQEKQFVPDPQRALWLSLVFPGAGQIYNRKFWKLPFIYGGFLGCTYALMWNQQMYMDYSQAYLDIMDDDPNTDSYLDMLPPRYDITGREEQFKTIFKNKKDRYRRYRDLSAFCFVGVYLLSVIDAYVDAHLSEFDISPDLSLRFEPAIIQQRNGTRSSNAYGIGCSFNF
jgi:hypothetical protein